MAHDSLRRLVQVAVVAIAGMLPATRAAADITAFVATTTQPANRPTFGVAAGAGLVAVGFEFELATANEAADSGAPSLRTGMVSGYVQNPIPIAGLQFYGIAGAGVYRERFGDADAETNVMTSVGGGVKMSLAGPLKLRVDYRVLLLRGEARYTSPKRLYAGLTVGF
jgi:hypothetical protein